MSDLIPRTLPLKAIVKSARDLSVLARHGYTSLSNIHEKDRADFEEWGIKDIDLIIESANEARTPKGVTSS